MERLTSRKKRIFLLALSDVFVLVQCVNGGAVPGEGGTGEHVGGDGDVSLHSRHVSISLASQTGTDALSSPLSLQPN